MQEPGLPENESDRIATLHSLNILDTPSDERFDRYTRISARIFDMPIAVISLVDRYRQWFKSAEGLDAEETPRSISFCGHAILGDDVFEIRNARRDPRFRDNPLVVEQPNIRFYAGAPLETPNGHKLGTLCLIDRVPRRLSDDEKRMLKNLANMVVGELINYIDTESGLDNRNALQIAGAKFFALPVQDRSFSLLLFDINDIIASRNDADSQLSPGEIFAKVLHSHFPEAHSMAHMGANHFCVLLKDEAIRDESRTFYRLSTDANASLCPKRHASYSAFAGRVQYDPQKYATFDDMMRQADELFLRHEKQLLPKPLKQNKLTRAIIGWRKTIF